MATVYAPIAYPPLPLLAFKLPDGGGGEDGGGVARLAATGSLRSCDPDRIVLKKIVLSGYPVKVRASPGQRQRPCVACAASAGKQAPATARHA